MKSKNTEIYVTMENVSEVTSILKKMIGKEKEDELKFDTLDKEQEEVLEELDLVELKFETLDEEEKEFLEEFDLDEVSLDTLDKEQEEVLEELDPIELKLETWYKEQQAFLEKEANNSQRLRALEYIECNQDRIFEVWGGLPYYVRFAAHIHVESILEYGSELTQANNFGASYESAFRKMQQAFKDYGFEFSDLIFSWTYDDHIILFWDTKYPILFTDILDYPKSLMAFAMLLDTVGIDGLDFNEEVQLFRDEAVDDRNTLKGEAFKEGYIIPYGNNDYHLTQNLIDDFSGNITYLLDGSYQILLDEKSDEDSIESVLVSGYHLVDKKLELGLDGIISSVECRDTNELRCHVEFVDFPLY